MSSLSRLSELNIEDDILRGIFYGLVMKHVSDPTAKLKPAIVRPNEEFRPDIMAYRVYGMPELRWCISLVCGISDEAEPLPVGEEFKFPEAIWIRQLIRTFSNDMGV